jgi:hypothetical protein
LSLGWLIPKFSLAITIGHRQMLDFKWESPEKRRKKEKRKKNMPISRHEQTKEEIVDSGMC